MLIELPKRVVLKQEMCEPIWANPRIESAEPSVRKSNTAMLEPKRVSECRDRCDPNVAIDRKDSELPRCKKSRIDMELPTCVKLRKANELPK
jgi:hypothetical protein